MYNFSQGQIFVFFLLIGVLISILFDIFRVSRKCFKTPDIITQIEDIAFIAITCILLTFCMVKLNNGEMRLYIFIAFFTGGTIYFLTISKVCVIILSIIINLAKKIFYFPIYLIKKVNFSRKKKKI